MENRFTVADVLEGLAIQKFSRDFDRELFRIVPPYIPTDIKEDCYLQKKYKHIYNIIKANMQLHSYQGLAIKFKFDKEDEYTEIIMDAPSFSHHIDIINPKWEFCDDSSVKCLNAFRKEFIKNK